MQPLPRRLGSQPRERAAAGTRCTSILSWSRRSRSPCAPARVTDGRVDPTVGNAIRALGYDDDFATIVRGTPARSLAARPVPGWRCITVDPAASTIRIPAGVGLDLGATAEGVRGRHRGPARARPVRRAGCSSSLGGDISVAGPGPRRRVGGPGGRRPRREPAGPGQTVSIVAGGLATSSVTVRRWVQGEQARHHVIDPRTGLPAEGPFRTVSVAAGTCVDANIATTAALVLGSRAPVWLAERRLPARLTRHDGRVVLVARVAVAVGGAGVIAAIRGLHAVVPVAARPASSRSSCSP